MSSKGAALKAAMADTRAGKPRQEVFATYQSQVSPDKHLAMAIATVPAPERIPLGAKFNKGLLGLLIFAAITKGLTALMMGSLFMLVLGLLVPVAFAIGVYKHEGYAYVFLPLLTGLGALTALLKMTEEGAVMLVEAALLGLMCWLALQVKQRVFPNLGWFSVRKDAQGNYLW
jgi:hypothetical protein